MPSSAVLTALQWSITVSGLIVFAFSLSSWLAAHGERYALRRTGQNGGMGATAALHLVTASTRLVCGVLSMGGGVALAMLPDFALPSGLIAGAVWMGYNLLLITNLAVEAWARSCVRAPDHEDAP
jgi:hypothetical protein